MLNPLELTGRARTHVVQRDDLRAAVHPSALAGFLDLKADAARDGIDIRIVSGFRDFDAQRAIWNRKFCGERPLYDPGGALLDATRLDIDALIDAILLWSALPGASRHHWGSELDVVDEAAMPEGYRIQLSPDEAAPGGVFRALHEWLDANLSHYGFFRPYCSARDGVSPEPWHLSFAAVSVPALAALTPEVIADALGAADILGKERVMERLPELYARYVANVDRPAGEATALA